jgi:predicted DsbA family dithiol-disulfide isomerase
MSALKLTFYVDVLSSWSFVAEQALDRLRAELGARLEVEWRIAFLFDGGPMGYSLEKNAWYYRRNRSVTGVTLNTVWRESMADTTWHANLAAQAARSLGIEDDRVRRALSRAAMVDGKHVGRRDVAVAIAASAAGVSVAELEKAMDDPRTAARMHETTAEFKALKLAVQPVFIFRNEIGDTAILSGLYTYETLAACAREMLAAADGYASFIAKNPEPKQ